MKDYTNQKFHKLTALKFVDFKQMWGRRRSRWLFRCDCGKEITASMDQVIGSCLKSCGCQKQSGSANYGWKGYQEISMKFWSNVRNNAKRRKIQFDISIEDAWRKYLKQEKKCALTNLDINFSTNTRSCDGTASIDRIDSSKGYSLDNIQWVHKNVNWMKQDFSEKEFIEYCRLVVQHKIP